MIRPMPIQYHDAKNLVANNSPWHSALPEDEKATPTFKHRKMKCTPPIAKQMLVLLILGIVSRIPVHAAPFVVSSDGLEVTDTQTGLIWQRCAVGMQWNQKTCTGTPQYFMWYEALPAAQDQARATGKVWRVPNVKELATILDRSHINQAIDPLTFPATPNDRFWSSSPYSTDAFFGWQVNFYDGAVYYTYLEDMGALRLVRGEP